jgi:hypothetical protein
LALKIKISKPSTIFLTAANPGAVKIYCNEKLYAERPAAKNFKFNLPYANNYIFSGVPLEIQDIKPLQKVIKTIELPTPDRDKPFGIKDIVYNNDSTSPARIFTNEQIICVNKKFFDYPIEVRMFILLHEVGHFFYTEEWKCDTFAAYHFLDMGFNPSQAFESLAGVLHEGKRNDERIENIFKLLSK